MGTLAFPTGGPTTPTPRARRCTAGTPNNGSKRKPPAHKMQRPASHIGMDAMAGLKIGEFAAAAGVGRDAVRHYERIGLLPAVVRNGAGYRVYSDDDLERLQCIRHVHEAGFSLEQTRDLLEASTANRDRIETLLGVTRAKLDAARDNVEWLSEVETFLTSLVAATPLDEAQPLWVGFQAGRCATRRRRSRFARGNC